MSVSKIDKPWWMRWTPGENHEYELKPIRVRAFRYGHENEPLWFVDAVKESRVETPLGKAALMHTKRGQQFVWAGDWIMTHADGSLEAMHHDEFTETYQPCK